MKRIIGMLAFCLVLCSTIFAQESKDGKAKKTGVDRPMRVEIGWTPLVGIDTKAAYMFPINDVLRWDVGMDVNMMTASSIDIVEGQRILNELLGKNATVGQSINIIPFGSFWFWDFYTSYGLGVGINTIGSAAFLPVDFRIGWQPGARKNRRFTFKLEAGLYGMAYSEKITDYYDTSKVLSKKTIFLVSPRTTIGLAVRF
ncbi:MAG: hypothetical protein ACTTHU_05210 [Treponema sp.]